ncbi:MAG: PH domain-containing protein [Mariniblastus sp.]|nr:PH domain-containing protein [Mariniblastus sp.]
MEERVIWDAEFNPSVTTYWLLGGALTCVVTVVGIVFLPFWIVLGKWLTGLYLDSHRCTLTSRNLKVSKGVLTKIEKTVPLDRITDLGIIQGPIMRWLNIESLSVETAGQSSASSLISLAGIKDGRNFRDAVLKQRDLVVGSKEEGESPAVISAGDAAAASREPLLEEIRDVLIRIEERLNRPE